jgi:membrane-bound serine protease (ClpP class)
MLGKEIATLFTGMPLPAIICLGVGLIFLFIEIFQPGFGIFGIIGIVLSVVGIVLRVIVNDGNIVAQIFIILFFEAIFVALAFVLMVITSKRAWLRKTPLIESTTVLPEDYDKENNQFGFLVSKTGISITPLRPAGKVLIDGETYDVVTDGFFISENEPIKVTSVEGGRILVQRVD